MIIINSVYKYVNNQKDERIRIVEVDDIYLYLVNIDATSSMPKRELITTIEAEIECNNLIKISDPYLKVIYEENLTELQLEKRDKDWKIVQNYWINHKADLLDRRGREKTISKIAKESNLSPFKVKKMFSRFWQRGMTRNALLPDYYNSGGRGKSKKLSEAMEAKIGRPRKVDFYGNSATGINITDNIKKQFEIAINKYYRNKKQISLKETYNYILKDFFSDRYKDKDGEIKCQVWDKSRIPTYDQFYYWFKKLENPKKDVTFRESAKDFELKYRPILSNSTIETNGPGTRFQIDATIADIYLVSSLDRNRIIGRPVVYAVIDVFSRLVTGIYVGLEGPSWVGAMMALDNMMTDKIGFCRRYGIDIEEEQWPSHHLPEIIIADRGEFEGYSVENLINNLGIKIENTSPYRGDLKGIVERGFRTTNTKLKHKTPGAVLKEFRKRGDRDYRLDATLTLEEFTKIYINMILHHNNTLIDKYPIEKEMIADEVIPIPTKLWSWGIANKKGRLKTIDIEIFRLNVLPKAKANISRAGIKFKNLYYSSQKAIEEQWFLKTKVRSIEVVYDPRNIDYIYILNNDGKSHEKCYLLEPSKQYKDCILEEVIFAYELLAELKEKEKDEINHMNINLDREIDNIVKKALEEKEKNGNHLESKNKRLKGIKNNRAVEKEVNRVSEAFEIEDEKIKTENGKSNIVNLTSKKEKENKELTAKDKLIEKLRRKRDEKNEK